MAKQSIIPKAPTSSAMARMASACGRVGNDAQPALTAKQKREKSLEAKAVGVELVEGAPATEKQTPLTEAVAEYLSEVKDSKAIKTYLAYSLTLRQFREAVRQESLEAIDRKDVLTFIAFMRSKGNGPRTIANRVVYLKGFFHRFGLKSPLLKTYKVRYTEKVVSGYSMPELQTLFAAADQEEHDLFQFFLCTGCRDGEVQHATWADIDFHRNLYTVKERLDLGFRPKEKEEGSIPLPDDFVARMKARSREVESPPHLSGSARDEGCSFPAYPEAPGVSCRTELWTVLQQGRSLLR